MMLLHYFLGFLWAGFLCCFGLMLFKTWRRDIRIFGYTFIILICAFLIPHCNALLIGGLKGDHVIYDDGRRYNLYGKF